VLSWLFPKKRAAAHFREGTLLAQRGKFAAAAERLRRAVELEPELAEAHFNLGSAYRDLGELEAALASYRRAAALRPGSADALLAIGALLRELGRYEEAIERLRQALAAGRASVEAHQELGNAHTALGNWREALEHFRCAVTLAPEQAEARWAAAMAQIPAIYANDAEPAERRHAFDAELAALEQWLRARERPGAYKAVAVHQPFYLAYQEVSNRELLARYGKLCAELMHGWQERAGLAARPAAGAGEPKRVGIVSAHIHDHSVWKALARGWIEELDPERFELHLFHLGTRRDAETRHAASRAAEFHEGRRRFEAWARLIHASRLDVLIYPEIGMDATTAKLAALRLAPAQAASWGHPETTGLPTIDYFLSAEGLEPADAQAHYTEKLVLLPNLGCFVSRPADEPAAEALPEVDGSGPLLVCPGTPFKYAPQFDRVLVEIARRVDKCRLVFFTGSPEALSAKFKNRLARAGLDLARHARFLPWLPPERFRGLMARADLYLDTIGFSGFNTALQGVACGLPIITREGRFLRGRLAGGILKRIGLAELVAPTEEAYIELAVTLANDAGRRQALRSRIEANRGRLYGDPAPVAALQEFLERI
jgi:predicted O-linked N-acetylglucosamine transferase (SPINDLY family)